jgi:hypothetical protein
MCDCLKLSECTEALPTRDEFMAGFRKLEHSYKLWVDFCVCENCGQYWIIEDGAEMDRRSNMAFKVFDPKNWITDDTSTALADWIIAKHGGLSNKKCIFYACNKMALKNMMVCVVHGHSEYKWTANT